MKKNIVLLILSLVMIIPLFSSPAMSSYEEMAARQKTAYLSGNGECVSFDGVIWTRNYGMNEYFLSPSYSNLQSSLQEIKGSGISTGGHRLVKFDLTSQSRAMLSEFSVKIPENYPFSTINVLLPAFQLQQVSLPYQEMEYNAAAKPETTREGNRQLIYMEDFEEDLGDEYEIDGWVSQPSIIYRNICWGQLDCEAYEGEQSLWCAADLYDSGWYTDPPDPCTSYTNWMWTYFALMETVDVTVAEDLVFEWWTKYSVDPAGTGDWCRVYIQDYPETDWMLISEYNGYQAWTDFQYELEGMSNVAYYFDFESDDQEYTGGVYLDNISIYNMVPNLTFGETNELDYPYNYSTIEPHNLRLQYDVLNDSNVDIEDQFSVEFLLSEDDDVTTTDDNYQLSEVAVAPPLPAGENVTGELIFNLDTITIPGIGELPEGDYYVIFYIDNNEEIDEYNEDDNIAASGSPITYGIANLTVGGQSGYTYPVNAGTSYLQIDVHVINDGTEATNDGFDIGYMLSADNDVTTLDDNYSLGFTTIGDILQAGGEVTSTFTIDLEQTAVPVDDYWIFYFIDANNAVAESNEYDNTWMSADEIDYAGAPYLQVDPMNLSFTADGGTDNIDVTSNTDWTVAYTSDWFTATPANGNGDGIITVVVTENSVSSERQGTITVSGAGEMYNITITQEAGSNLMYGDVNSSGIVDSYDAALTLQYVVGIPTGVDPFPEMAADVDGNNEISAYDASLIMQYTVGIITSFPVENMRVIISE